MFWKWFFLQEPALDSHLYCHTPKKKKQMLREGSVFMLFGLGSQNRKVIRTRCFEFIESLINIEQLLWSSCSLLLYLPISQEQNFSPAMKRRSIAFLSAFSTAMLILSNLVFLGGIHVGRVFWKRVFIQGKLPSTTLTQ